MNEETVQRTGDNEPLDLGTEFRIDLWGASVSQTDYTIDQLSAALKMTTTLTDLTVGFKNYEPTPENNRRIVEPLCLCLSNLRCRNEHHPLRALTLQSADLREHGMLDVFEQFLIAAAKYGGIYHFKLNSVHHFPIQCLVGFCRNNNNLKFLEMAGVSFSDFRAEMSLLPNRTQDSSAMLALDKLCVSFVSFNNSAAATAFADFMARTTVQGLVLGEVCADDNDKITECILSEIKVPSANRLELQGFCRTEHFKAALEAGTASLMELNVNIDYADNYTESLETLTSFIRRSVQLNSLTIPTYRWRFQPITLQREFFRAIEACATITRIRVFDIDDFSRDEMQQLQGITARNKELAGFVASPSTYPTENLLALMRQFDNCPTGRYMLARILPVVLSFETIKNTDSSRTESNPKKRKIS